MIQQNWVVRTLAGCCYCCLVDPLSTGKWAAKQHSEFTTLVLLPLNLSLKTKVIFSTTCADCLSLFDGKVLVRMALLESTGVEFSQVEACFSDLHLPPC